MKDETRDRSETRGDAGEEEAAKPPVYRRRWFWIVVIVVLAVLVAGAVYYERQIAPFETTDDAFIDADVVDIAPQVSGRVSAVPVEENARVKAGDLLMEIDAAALRAAKASADAELAQAEAQLRSARAGVEQAQAQAAEAEAERTSVEVQAQNAHDTLKRDEDLIASDQGAISQKAVVDARDAARAADAEAEAARRRVATAGTAIGAAEADVAAVEAAVEAAKARVESAGITLGYARITAPLDGQVVQTSVNVGSFVTEGTPVMAIVPDRLYVTANFKETQLDRIRPGQAVSMTVDAFPDVKFRGEVVSIQNGAGQAFQLLPPQNATGNYVKVVQRVPVRISIEAPDLADYPLGPGMSVVPRVRVE